VHLECDAPAQSAVEAELVSEHPLTFNTVTQHDMGWDVALVMPVELWSGRRLDASLEARLV
jgi:hypothetical protein